MESVTWPLVEVLIQGFAFVVAATAVAWWTSVAAVDRWRGSWRVQAVLPLLMALWSTALMLRFGCSVAAMAGALYGVLALYASYADLRCREVDDYIHLMLLLVGLLGAQPLQVPAMALAGVVATLPMLAVVVLFRCPMGGADVKYTAAFAFGTGLLCGWCGLTAGLVLAVIHQSFKNKKGQGFPLIPYLSVGFLLSYLFVGGV